MKFVIFISLMSITNTLYNEPQDKREPDETQDNSIAGKL